MSFRESLRTIVKQVDGAVGAVIMGYDGIPIDEYIRANETMDVQMLAVEYATLLKDIKRTVEVLKTGAMEEVAVSTGDVRIIIRTLSDEFFLVLLIESEGNFGKGRYLLKINGPKLRDELHI